MRLYGVSHTVGAFRLRMKFFLGARKLQDPPTAPDLSQVLNVSSSSPSDADSVSSWEFFPLPVFYRLMQFLTTQLLVSLLTFLLVWCFCCKSPQRTRAKFRPPMMSPFSAFWLCLRFPFCNASSCRRTFSPQRPSLLMFSKGRGFPPFIAHFSVPFSN